MTAAPVELIPGQPNGPLLSLVTIVLVLSAIGSLGFAVYYFSCSRSKPLPRTPFVLVGIVGLTVGMLGEAHNNAVLIFGGLAVASLGTAGLAFRE